MIDNYPENESGKVTADDDQSKINEDKSNHLDGKKKFSKSITKSCDTPNADKSKKVDQSHFFCSSYEIHPMFKKFLREGNYNHVYYR